MSLPRFRTERRELNAPLLRFLAPLLSVLVALFVAGFLLLAAGVDPAAAYLEIFRESVGSIYGLSETLVKATPLIFAGLGVSLAFRMQIWNIGAEGQIYIGAMAASGVALFSGIENHLLMLTCMLVAAFICGGLWAGVAGLLRVRWQVNEVIVTLLMNYIAILWTDYLLFGAWKDPKGFNFPLSAQFSDAARLGDYFNTRLHSGFFLALFCALLLYLLMERTVWGFEIKAIGSNPQAAQYAGMKTGPAIVLVLFLSGALAALAGFSEVAGLQHRLIHGISPGYGYTAIIIAWLARRSALGVVVVSFLMGILLVGGDSLQLTWQLPIAFIYAFQGLILFFLLAADFFLQYRIRRVAGGDA
ncbi:ABC transporter permease [Geothermobacter hydrogeniphilus]|uniref:ABC transporter permease n=1 Tax=Geothermobacter hydrogeniphilus TaxID=1969733 RepID=A0A2K2HE06_9BACT|nr:ABC transporter permease [Geothermobacter hydrogeniphilus]PNU21483.1 ABC transporter permease [Geothermobacter hydrogeniphilus]